MSVLHSAAPLAQIITIPALIVHLILRRRRRLRRQRAESAEPPSDA